MRQSLKKKIRESQRVALFSLLLSTVITSILIFPIAGKLDTLIDFILNNLIVIF
jgi:hypothetical protein